MKTIVNSLADKTEHKQAQTLTNGIIELNRQSMEELFYTMRIAEKVKKQ